MGKPHTEQLVLAQQIKQAEEKVTVGALYQHFKSEDKIYKVIGLGILESNEEIHVIYQPQYNEKLTFLRLLSSWLEQVEWEGKIVARFTKL